MDDLRLTYDAFNIYYKNGIDALNKNNYEIARRNIYLASETLLKLAKMSEGVLKQQRLKRATDLMELANKIALKKEGKLSTSNNVQYNGDVSCIDVKDVGALSNDIVQKTDNISLEEALKNLNSLIGLQSVKNQINDWVEQIRVFKIREKNELKVPPISYHLIFVGNPGTGKTTVARIIAQIYYALGITKTPNFVEVDRTDLVAGYVGQTAIKTKEVINKAKGGVLFIDEAYTLSNKGENDFGREAIDTLLKIMEDEREDLIVIVAGYEELMNQFIDSNPGLKSRFKTIIKFDDYTPDELFDVFMALCKKTQYIIEQDACELLKEVIIKKFKNRTDKFGNGRDMRNLFEAIITSQSKRVGEISNPTRIDLMTIKKEDLLAFDEFKQEDNSLIELNYNFDNYKKNFKNNEFNFEWDELPNITFDDVVGLDNVKEEVKMKVLLPIKHPEALEGYKKKNGGGLLLFGPPGTGKTMIAAAIANEIGAKFCSIKPSDLLHAGAGNTEKAVKALFDQARQYRCSVICFDEIDAITQKDTRSTYSKQLRSELLAQLQGIDSYNKENGNILYLIALTNKPWDIDSAFIRPGRFGTRIYVGLPDDNARRHIVEKRLNEIRDFGIVQVVDNIDLEHIVDATIGFNASDIINLLDKVEEISIVRSLNENTKYITNDDFNNALLSIRSSIQKEDLNRLLDWKIKNNID